MPGGTHPGCYGTPKFLGHYRGSATPKSGYPRWFSGKPHLFPFLHACSHRKSAIGGISNPFASKKSTYEVFWGYYQTLSRVKISHYVHKKWHSKLFANSFSYAKPLLMTPSDPFYPPTSRIENCLQTVFHTRKWYRLARSRANRHEIGVKFRMCSAFFSTYK